MSGIEPELCNCSALRRAARHVTRFYDSELAATGLGVNQYSILVRLSRVGPSAIRDLARWLVMDRSTLGRLLRPLAKRGLVGLDVSQQDRRRRAVTLTPAGRALVVECRPLWAVAQRRFESKFGEQAALNLRTMLKQVEIADFGAVAALADRGRHGGPTHKAAEDG